MADALTYDPETYDPEAGRRAFSDIKPELDRLTERELININGDIGQAAPAALQVVQQLNNPELLGLLKQMPRFEVRWAEDLPKYIWAAWYARAQLHDVEAGESSAKLPADLAERARSRRERMLKLMEYYFDDDENVAPVLASIRAGSGYRDLATDLVRLAESYDAHVSSIKGDAKHYRASDAREARRDAQTILLELGDNRQAGDSNAAAYAQRSWTLLSKRYDQVRNAVLYLQQDNPTAREAFPPLVSIARRAAKSKPVPQAPPPEAPGTATPAQ